MLPAFHGFIRDPVVFRFLKAAEQITGGKQPLRGLRDLLLRHQPLFICLQKMQVGDAAVYVAARLQCHRRGFLRRLRHAVVLVKIPDGPAVRHEMPLKAPFSPQDIPDQRIASAAGLSVGAVVGSHDRLRLRFLYAGFKGGKIGFIQILFSNLRVEFMAQALRAGMHRKMLGAGRRFQVFLLFVLRRAGSLQALHIGHAKAGGQIRVLSVGLMPSSPSGVPENIHVRRPEGQSLVNVPVAVPGGFVVLGASLRRHRVSDPAQQAVVKGRRHPDGLREAGCHSRSRHAVQRLVPPVVRRDPEPWDRRRVIPELGSLFLQRHLRYQFLCGRFGLLSVDHFFSP